MTDLPPQDIEAEQRVLACLISLPAACDGVVPLLKAEDFYREAHRLIYAAIVEVATQGEPVDIITVEDALKDRGQVKETGGFAYLASLVSACPNLALGMHYASRVKRAADDRKAISLANEVEHLVAAGKAEEARRLLDEREAEERNHDSPGFEV